MINIKIEHRCTGQKNLDYNYTAYSRLYIAAENEGDYFEIDSGNPTSLIYRPYIQNNISPRITMSGGDFTPSRGVIYETNDEEEYNIVITVDYDPYTPPSSGDDDNQENNSNTSTAIIRYFFKSSGDPADYTDYVGDGSYTKTINHYGLSLVAGSTTTITLTYYTDSEQSETGTYSITSPKTGYLLYNIVPSPELGQEDYKNVDYDIKVYCFKAPTITVAYASTPDKLFGEPATIFVQPDAYGNVGSFTADWGMIGGMTVFTSFRLNTGYKFLNWTIEKGSTTETKTENEYRYTVDSFDNVTITANFERLPAVTLQVIPSTAGVVSPSAGVKTPTDDDYKIKLTASPNENYKFDKWTKNSDTISTAQEYTYIASQGENTTITANFSSTTQPDTPEEPSDGEIATNKYIKDNILYVYSGYTDLEQNQCPIKTQIISRGGNAISIKNSENYTNEQCVKESDITYGGRNAKIKVYLKGGSGSRSIETFEIYDGNTIVANISGDSYSIDNWHTLFSTTKFTANNGSNNIFVRIGKFGVTSEIYSYFGVSDPSVTEDWLDKNSEFLGQLGNNETTKFDCKENWDTWIKGSNTMYIIIKLY